MSAVSASVPGSQRRSLAELLAGRAQKPERTAESSIRKIQEAAVYLLSCHQDGHQFLLEVEEPPCKKVYNGDASEPDLASCHTLLPEAFIASTLRDQASHAGVAADMLGAKTAASAIQVISRGTQGSVEGALLQPDQRLRLTSLLKTLKGLLAENCFRRSVFLQEMWKQERPPVLEVVWHLQSMDIVGLEDVLESCKDGGGSAWFCREMKSLCQQFEDSPADLELIQQIISNLMAVLIGRAFSQPLSSVKHSEPSKMTKISLSILNAMLSWLLDAVLKAGKGQPYVPGVERHWLIAYTASRYRARVIPEHLEDFFLHTLNQTLTYKPELKVSDAIRFQGTWSFAKTCPLLTDLYRKLFVLLSAEKLTSNIQRVLDTQEVNWHHVLSFVSCLVICQSESQHLVKDLLSRLLSQAFENYELEYLITAFLIARQAAQEGPAAFISYTEWFKNTFGASSSYQSSSKKSLVFLLKFLSDLVPFETPQYLKVHILHPPFVPTKFRPLLMEYISLAKTRLADMKVSIEDMGLYEDLSASSDKDQAQSQAQQDVEKAVQIFENTGKIPASVMEASIFRRPYFTTRFLPALLSPRVLPEVPDSHMLLIDSLKRADKIPVNMISAYLDACELQKHRKLEGKEQMNMTLNEEPIGKLQSALWELRPFVTDPKRYDDIYSQVAVISERLTTVLGPEDPHVVPLNSESLFSLNIEDLDPQQLAVSDLLLTSFCQCVMAASSTNPPDRQGPWATLYVKMLCGHHKVLFAVLTRGLQLLCHKAALLKDFHIVGLATFSVHLHECWTSLSTSEVVSLEKFWEALLSPFCSNSHSVLLRFCTAAVSYACCRFSLLSPGTSSSCIPPLIKRKLHHLLPRLVLEARREGMAEDDVDASLIFRGQSLPSGGGWKEAAVSLWHQTCFQELLKEPNTQLSFREWLQWEMSLDPDTDPLCDMERQDYQRWAIHQQFLPESSAAGGCDNDLEKACLIMADAVLDFNNGSLIGPRSPPSTRTGLSDMLCRLQELVCDVMIRDVGPLLNLFHQRLEKLANCMETGAQLQRQSELAMCCRILLSLPSSLLVPAIQLNKMESGALGSEAFFHFVNKHLKSISQRGYALPYNITAHYFRGLLGPSRDCETAEEMANNLLSAAYSLCPILLTSAALWWPQLDPAIRCQWNRQFGGNLPKEIGALQGIQKDVDRCLSQGSVPSSGAITWLSAAFLYFTIQRNKTYQKRLKDILSTLNIKSVQLLDCLLFFSILDLIPLTLKQEEAAQKLLLDNCLDVIQCLEARGGNWLTIFQKSAHNRKSPLYQAVSVEFLKLLPLAFFRLALCLPVDDVVRREDFLPLSLEMYDDLFQLFLDGSPLLHPQQAEPQTLFSRGRHFLLSCILRCPKPSAACRSHLSQSIGSWEERDPELSGLLKSFLHSPQEDSDLYEEPDLF